MNKVSQNVDTTSRQNFFCQLEINGVQLIPSNILSLTIREWIFNTLPRIELIIMDDGVLTEGYSVIEGSLIDVSIGNDENDENILSMQFEAQDVAVDVLGDNKMTNIVITGLMKTNNIFKVKNRVIQNRSSIEALTFLANEVGLSIDNLDNISTLDRMSWLQINIDNFKMFKHILARANKPEDVIFCFGNSQSKLNITSLKTIIEKPEIIRCRYNLEKFSQTSFDQNEKEIVWFNSYDVVNINGTFHKMGGTGFAFDYYDKQVNRKKNSNKNYLIADIEDTSTSNMNTEHQIFGMQSENVYEEYFESIVRNKQLLYSFFGQSMVLAVNPVSIIKLAEKLDVLIPSMVNNEINDVLSGQYIVGGITHNVSKGAFYRKRISIHRSGLNAATIVNVRN